MKARIQWAGEAMFLGESGSGHVVVMDGAPESGGRNLGARPMEMVLIGLGGCSNFDVVSILKKARQPIESCEAFLEAERATEDPKVFTKMYCSASIMLGDAGVEITHDYEIVELG
jgi:putative redox protein